MWIHGCCTFPVYTLYIFRYIFIRVLPGPETTRALTVQPLCWCNWQGSKNPVDPQILLPWLCTSEFWFQTAEKVALRDLSKSFWTRIRWTIINMSNHAQIVLGELHLEVAITYIKSKPRVIRRQKSGHKSAVSFFHLDRLCAWACRDQQCSKAKELQVWFLMFDCFWPMHISIDSIKMLIQFGQCGKQRWAKRARQCHVFLHCDLFIAIHWATSATNIALATSRWTQIASSLGEYFLGCFPNTRSMHRCK